MTATEFKAWRERLGLSQLAAADRLGLSRGSIELYERGTRRDDGRAVAIPRAVELACERVTRLWKQEQRGLGPVSLIYADGPTTQPINGPSNPPMVRIEQFQHNEDAVNRACSLMNSPNFYHGFISDDDDVIWNPVELRAECRKRAGSFALNTKKTTACRLCGLVVWKVVLDAKPTLKYHIDDFEQRCAEPSRAPEPFRCPHLLSAAMDEGWLETNGRWKSQS